MARSWHKNLRSLQRYVRPSPGAVAALTAQQDPARQRIGPGPTRAGAPSSEIGDRD